MRATASATTAIHCSPLSAPSANDTLAGAVDLVEHAATVGASGPTVVSQARPPRRPTTTWGTTSTESPGSSAKAKEPKPTESAAGLAHLVADGRSGDRSPTTTCRRR